MGFRNEIYVFVSRCRSPTKSSRNKLNLTKYNNNYKNVYLKSGVVSARERTFLALSSAGNREIKTESETTINTVNEMGTSRLLYSCRSLGLFILHTYAERQPGITVQCDNNI